jgi:copper(I)-binding protein
LVPLAGTGTDDRSWSTARLEFAQGKETMSPTKTILLAALLGASPLALAAAPAPASAFPPASITVSDCWIRLLPGSLPAGGYFKVSNTGGQAVDLVGVSTDAFGMAMLHQTQSQTGTSKMVMVDRVSVPAGGTFGFTPGHYHLMLEQPRRPLKIGTTIPVTFAFSNGAKIGTTCAIKSAGTVEQ